jgi:hypothetical protein
MIIVCALVQGDRTGHADRQAALPRLDKSQDLAISHEHIDGCARGRHLSAIVKGQFPGRILINEHEATATDAGALRLDEAKYRVSSNRGINRMATLFQHLDRGGDGMRIRRRCNCPAAPDPGWIGGGRIACDSGTRSRVFRGRARSDEQDGRDGMEALHSLPLFGVRGGAKRHNIPQISRTANFILINTTAASDHKGLHSPTIMPLFKRTLSEFLFRRFVLKHDGSNLLVDLQIDAK